MFRSIMMIRSALMCGIFAAGIVLPAVLAEPPQKPLITGSIPASVEPAEQSTETSRLVFYSANAASSCRAWRGVVRDGKAPFQAEPACNELWPGLSLAGYWRENGDTFEITGANGETLLRLGAGDGIAFEVFEPPAAMLTVSLEN